MAGLSSGNPHASRWRQDSKSLPPSLGLSVSEDGCSITGSLIERGASDRGCMGVKGHGAQPWGAGEASGLTQSKI